MTTLEAVRESQLVELLRQVDGAAAVLRKHRNLPLAEIVAACRRDMEEFLHGEPRGDDLTLLALRRVG